MYNRSSLKKQNVCICIFENSPPCITEWIKMQLKIIIAIKYYYEWHIYIYVYIILQKRLQNLRKM